MGRSASHNDYDDTTKEEYEEMLELIDETEETVYEALEDRFVSSIHVNTDDNIVAVLMGRQYRPDTAREIVSEEVPPALDSKWRVDAGVAPGGEFESGWPQRCKSMTMIQLLHQDVRDVQFNWREMGVAVSGVEDYLDERGFETHDVPPTYSGWEDGWDDDVLTEWDEGDAVQGPLGAARNAGGGVQYCWQTDYLKAALGILNGKGRFDEDDYQFHTGVPFAVLEGPKSSVLVAPVVQYLDGDEVDWPVFRYDESGSAGTEQSNISLAGGDCA